MTTLATIRSRDGAPEVAGERIRRLVAPLANTGGT